MVNWAANTDAVFFKQLIWRIFMQILFNFPRVTNNFKPAYDGIQWLNNEDDFKRWCSELLDINGGRWNASTTKQVICTIEYVWWWQVFFVNIY
jgi:hypothetical protein